MAPTAAKDVSRQIARLLEHHPVWMNDATRGPVTIGHRQEFSDGRLAAFELSLESGELFRVQVTRIPR